jgi:hypothetical protein
MGTWRIYGGRGEQPEPGPGGLGDTLWLTHQGVQRALGVLSGMARNPPGLDVAYPGRGHLSPSISVR